MNEIQQKQWAATQFETVATNDLGVPVTCISMGGNGPDFLFKLGEDIGGKGEVEAQTTITKDQFHDAINKIMADQTWTYHCSYQSHTIAKATIKVKPKP